MLRHFSLCVLTDNPLLLLLFFLICVFENEQGKGGEITLRRSSDKGLKLWGCIKFEARNWKCSPDLPCGGKSSSIRAITTASHDLYQLIGNWKQTLNPGSSMYNVRVLIRVFITRQNTYLNNTLTLSLSFLT